MKQIILFSFFIFGVSLNAYALKCSEYLAEQNTPATGTSLVGYTQKVDLPYDGAYLTITNDKVTVTDKTGKSFDILEGATGPIQIEKGNRSVSFEDEPVVSVIRGNSAFILYPHRDHADQLDVWQRYTHDRPIDHWVLYESHTGTFAIIGSGNNISLVNIQEGAQEAFASRDLPGVFEEVREIEPTETVIGFFPVQAFEAIIRVGAPNPKDIKIVLALGLEVRGEFAIPTEGSLEDNVIKLVEAINTEDLTNAGSIGDELNFSKKLQHSAIVAKHMGVSDVDKYLAAAFDYQASPDHQEINEESLIHATRLALYYDVPVEVVVQKVLNLLKKYQDAGLRMGNQNLLFAMIRLELLGTKMNKQINIFEHIEKIRDLLVPTYLKHEELKAKAAELEGQPEDDLLAALAGLASAAQTAMIQSLENREKLDPNLVIAVAELAINHDVNDVIKTYTEKILPAFVGWSEVDRIATLRLHYLRGISVEDAIEVVKSMDEWAKENFNNVLDGDIESFTHVLIALGVSPTAEIGPILMAALSKSVNSKALIQAILAHFASKEVKDELERSILLGLEVSGN